MDPEQLENRLQSLERGMEELRRELEDILRRQKNLHNLLHRFAVSLMVISESLEHNQIIKSRAFRERFAVLLKSLDREISERKIVNFLESLWKELEEKD